MATRLTPEALPDYFVRYLFEKYHGTRHVRRVASWVGFVVKSIERVVGATFERRRSRQIEFDYHGRQFKVRYVHRTKASPRDGIRLSRSRRVAAHRLVIRRPGVDHTIATFLSPSSLHCWPKWKRSEMMPIDSKCS